MMPGSPPEISDADGKKILAYLRGRVAWLREHMVNLKASAYAILTDAGDDPAKQRVATCNWVVQVAEYAGHEAMADKIQEAIETLEKDLNRIVVVGGQYE